VDPGDPVGALATVIAEAARDFDLGPRRRELLDQTGSGRITDS